MHFNSSYNFVQIIFYSFKIKSPRVRDSILDEGAHSFLEVIFFSFNRIVFQLKRIIWHEIRNFCFLESTIVNFIPNHCFFNHFFFVHFSQANVQYGNLYHFDLFRVFLVFTFYIPPTTLPLSLHFSALFYSIPDFCIFRKWSSLKDQRT